MKKTTFITGALAITCVIIMCSYVNGPATHGWDCTGAETDSNNPKGCSTGSGCHSNSATTGITLALELDSAGVPVTSYTPGQVYTVKLTGTNTTTNNLPQFGFQVTAIKGATTQASPTNAGTFQQTGLPAGVHYLTPENPTYLVANIVEHDVALSPLSGTGGTGTVYQESFTWTAPVAGTGTVSLWAVLNAVNGNGSADAGDLWNTKNLVLSEDTTGTMNAIAQVSENFELTVYPNPVTDIAEITLPNTATGNYQLNAYDVEGRKVYNAPIGATGSFTKTTLNMTGFTSGIYLLQITNGTEQKVVRVVKK